MAQLRAGLSRHPNPREDDRRVRAGLDDDPPVFAGNDVEVLPTLTVRDRTLTGYSDDGDPQFGWATIVSGVAVEWRTREERDDVAGRTLVTGFATMEYAGEDDLRETAVVGSSHGGTWSVTSAIRSGPWLHLELVRLDDVDA